MGGRAADPGRLALCLCRRANARPRLDAQAALEPGKDTAAYPRGAATLPLAVQWVCGRAPRVPRSRREAALASRAAARDERQGRSRAPADRKASAACVPRSTRSSCACVRVARSV